MRLEEAGSEDLVAHAAIPIRFLVDRVLEPDPAGGPLDFVERSHPAPWLKDYDAEEGGNPALWPTRSNTSRWRIISAWVGASRVGGGVLFANVPGMDMLEGRSDPALIWDLRVTPSCRGSGVGRRLVSAAVAWSRSRACRELKVETQNINLGACRFYRAQGFELRTVAVDTYPGLPDELQMHWYRGVV